MPGKNRSMQKKMAKKKQSGSNAKPINKAMNRLDEMIAAKKAGKKKAKRK